MKAAVVPAVSSSWQIKDVPQPQPGPGQVLVKMHASGICYTDVHQTLGHLPGQFPRILGHEPVGEIVAMAPDVTTRKVGDRVGSAWIQSTCGRCEWCQRGRRMFCPYLKGTGGDAQGGHAEYMLMNADATYLIPDKVSYEQAAPIFCAGYTVYSGLRWADPQPHERVAVLGIGGLGHLAGRSDGWKPGWPLMPSWVFCTRAGTPMDESKVRRRDRRVLDHAGLPLHFSPHCLRHTYASLMLQQGESLTYVQRQLGHARSIDCGYLWKVAAAGEQSGRGSAGCHQFDRKW